jgi:hypothetical protein
MKRIRVFFGMLLIASILVSQTGCMLFTTRRVAVGAGKFVYNKMKSDKDEGNNEQDGDQQ